MAPRKTAAEKRKAAEEISRQGSFMKRMFSRPSNADNVGPAPAQPDLSEQPSAATLTRPCDATNASSTVPPAPRSIIDDEPRLTSYVEIDSPVSDGGSTTTLTLYAVLLHAFHIAIAFAIKNCEGAEFLRDVLGAEYFVSVVQSGMPEALWRYLDFECVRKGLPWNAKRIAELLHPRDSIGSKIGCYFFLLDNDWLYEYCGASWNMMGMNTRIVQHFNPERRSKLSTYFYKVWESVKHPVHHIDVGAICFLTKALLSEHGVLPFLTVETVLIGLFTSVALKSDFKKIPGLIHDDLLTAFRAYLDAPDMPLASVMEAAVSKMSGKPTRSANHSVPLLESHNQGLIRGIKRLGSGLTCKVAFEKATFFHLGGKTDLTISPTFLANMQSDGFSQERPMITVTIELANEEDPRNFANVSENTGTSSNPLGFELAHRILVRVSFVRADESIGSVFIQHSARTRNELLSACLAMTLYEHSVGLIDEDEEVDRRRFDFNKTIEDQGAKAWSADAPEMADFNEKDRRPFECKACGKRYNSVGELRWHLGFNLSRETSAKMKAQIESCKKTWGISKASDITPDNCLVPGMSKRPGLMHYCAGCKKGFPRLGDLRDHLFGRGTKPKPSTVQCRAAYGDLTGPLDPKMLELSPKV